MTVLPNQGLPTVVRQMMTAVRMAVEPHHFDTTAGKKFRVVLLGCFHTEIPMLLAAVIRYVGGVIGTITGVNLESNRWIVRGGNFSACCNFCQHRIACATRI